MTIYANLPAVEAPAPEPRRRWSRRRIAITAAVTVVLLAVIGTGIGWAVYANTYQPLQVGNFGGGLDPHLRTVTDGVTDTRLVLFGPVGTQGRTEVSIRNSGSHAVRILGLGDTFGRFTATWGPDRPAPPTGYVGGTPAQARRFPVVLRPGHELALFLLVTKPGCDRYAVEEWDQIPIRWSALGVHHTWELSLTGSLNTPIAVCAPAKARNYIDNR